MEIEPTKKVILVVDKNRPQWSAKKEWRNCSEKEKEEANLMEIPSDEILCDYESDEEYQIGKELISKSDYKITEIWNTHSDEHPGGKHIVLKFSSLSKYDVKIRNEIRRIIIKKFKADETKYSEKTFIPIPNKLHYKSGKIYSLVEKTKENINELSTDIVKEAKKTLEKIEEFNSPLQADKDFEDYFEKDIFWKKLNKIDWTKMPMACNFNWCISKNLAIAAIKSGKSKIYSYRRRIRAKNIN